MLKSLKWFIETSPLAAATSFFLLAISLYIIAMTVFDIWEVVYLRAENQAIRENCLSKEGQK